MKRLITGCRTSGATKQIIYRAIFWGREIRFSLVKRDRESSRVCVRVWRKCGVAWMNGLLENFANGGTVTHDVSDNENSRLNPSTLSREKNIALHMIMKTISSIMKCCTYARMMVIILVTT